MKVREPYRGSHECSQTYFGARAKKLRILITIKERSGNEIEYTLTNREKGAHTNAPKHILGQEPKA